jgi:uncharacterized repeat protein (TIGR01451 family)
VGLALVGGSVAAQESEPQALVISATNLTAGPERLQALEARGGDPNSLLNGDVLEYRLVFTNVTEQPLRNIQFTDPLPEGLHYLHGTAGADREDVDLEFSIDGGVSYSEQPMVEVVVDGRTELRPASPESYTHVRWTVQGEVQPDMRVVAAFQVRYGTPQESRPGW